MHASCNHRLAIAINSIKYDINKVKLATAFPQQCLALSLDWRGGGGGRGETLIFDSR